MVLRGSLLFSIMTSLTSFLTGNPGRSARRDSVKPSVTANGAIAHSRIARGSMSSQCSRRPTDRKVGMRGTCSMANPVRTDHQLADTAMAKARTAVYSASSLDG